MTALRPGRDPSGAPYDANAAYGDAGGARGGAGSAESAGGVESAGGAGGVDGAGDVARGDAELEAAVDDLTDPLTDPLPGQHPSPWFRSGPASEPQPKPRPEIRTESRPEPPSEPHQGQRPRVPRASREPQATPEPTYEQLYGAYSPQQAAAAATPPSPRSATPPYEPIRRDDETVGLRTVDTRRAAAGPESHGLTETTRPLKPVRSTEPVRPPEPVRPAEGRAARRKAAKKGGRRPVQASPALGAPLSRVEARRAERARRPSAGTVISRGLGEVFITLGVLMLLFVTYQLWWTNIRAQQQADGAAHDLQSEWAKGKGKPGTFEPGQGFALLHIPKLDVVVPVAEGIDKHKVLDRGMVGHYNEGVTKTAMPDADPGNFAVAGHRNTHGEPFRYINRLEPGDPIVVETQDTYFVYKMANILPQTNPSNTSVIGPVPPGSGFTKPGRYITLTTCTPEFTSKYRMIVWGKMAEERPRSKGKPSALVN